MLLMLTTILLKNFILYIKNKTLLFRLKMLPGPDLLELVSAVNFLAYTMKIKQPTLNEIILQKFKECFYQILQSYYLNRLWGPSQLPNFSVIRIQNEEIDYRILQAAELCELSKDFIKKCFPSQLLLWIDPTEVCIRFSEKGPTLIIYDVNDKQAWEPPLCKKYKCDPIQLFNLDKLIEEFENL